MSGDGGETTNSVDLLDPMVVHEEDMNVNVRRGSCTVTVRVVDFARSNSSGTFAFPSSSSGVTAVAATEEGKDKEQQGQDEDEEEDDRDEFIEEPPGSSRRRRRSRPHFLPALVNNNNEWFGGGSSSGITIGMPNNHNNDSFPILSPAGSDGGGPSRRGSNCTDTDSSITLPFSISRTPSANTLRVPSCSPLGSLEDLEDPKLILRRRSLLIPPRTSRAMSTSSLEVPTHIMGSINRRYSAVEGHVPAPPPVMMTSEVMASSSSSGRKRSSSFVGSMRRSSWACHTTLSSPLETLSGRNSAVAAGMIKRRMSSDQVSPRLRERPNKEL